MNQYTNENAFVPEYDLSGNQTKILTSTGIWEVLYNAKNRPTKFTQGTTIITCSYNFAGARAETKITTNGAITKHERYVNRGYLLIACLDLTRATQNDLYLLFWDPTQPITTRPLAIQKGGTWYSYGHDLTKNITETFTNTGTIAGTYLYSPFETVTKTGTFEQPIQFSSEIYDSELGLNYYHFRHYNTKDGRWISRDLIGERGGWNEYAFLMNGFGVDRLGPNFDIIFGGISPPHFKCRCKPHKTNEAVVAYNKCLSKCNDILDECKKMVEKNQCAIPGNEPDSIYDQEYVRIRTATATELAICFLQHKRCASQCKSALDKSPNVIPPCYCFPPDFNFLAPPK